jgi:hypothetical protein
MDIILRFIFLSFIPYWLSTLTPEVSFLATVVARYILFIGFLFSWIDAFAAFRATVLGFVVFDSMRSASP